MEPAVRRSAVPSALADSAADFTSFCIGLAGYYWFSPEALYLIAKFFLRPPQFATAPDDRPVVPPSI